MDFVEPIGVNFGKSRLEKFQTVSEIFDVKLLPFSPHIVTTDDISEPHKRHMIAADGMYKNVGAARP